MSADHLNNYFSLLVDDILSQIPNVAVKTSYYVLNIVDPAGGLLGDPQHLET